MSTEFKTPKGTILPLLNLKGKEYLQVAHRLVWFREEHPDWSIQTEFVEINTEKKYAIAKALILTPKNEIIATAHKTETSQGFADYLEKAETGAIGRALAMCGYGTQFAPEIEEADRIVDSPVHLDSRVKSAPHPTGDGLPEDGKTAELQLFIKSSETATSKAGKEYWRVETDLGPMSSFVELEPGDSYWVLVKGSTYNGTMSYAITSKI